jgi:hypothetical protein
MDLCGFLRNGTCEIHSNTIFYGSVRAVREWIPDKYPMNTRNLIEFGLYLIEFGLYLIEFSYGSGKNFAKLNPWILMRKCH